jgi:hypothetical protein
MLKLSRAAHVNLTRYPDVIKAALTTCPGLTAFEMGNAADSNLLEILLTHGKHLHQVTLGSLNLHRSISADVQCSWGSLNLLDQGPDWPHSWSHLPPQLASICTPLPTYISIPLAGTDDDQQTQVLSQAATKLAAGLQKQGRHNHTLALALFEQAEKHPSIIDYLQALALLNGYISSLCLSVAAGQKVRLGSEEVKALGQGLGKGLSRLTLLSCQLHSSFWPALLVNLPALQVLKLGTGVGGAVSGEEVSQLVTAGPISSHHSLEFISAGSSLMRWLVRASWTGCRACVCSCSDLESESWWLLIDL